MVGLSSSSMMTGDARAPERAGEASEAALNTPGGAGSRSSKMPETTLPLRSRSQRRQPSGDEHAGHSAASSSRQLPSPSSHDAAAPSMPPPGDWTPTLPGQPQEVLENLADRLPPQSRIALACTNREQFSKLRDLASRDRLAHLASKVDTLEKFRVLLGVDAAPADHVVMAPSIRQLEIRHRAEPLIVLISRIGQLPPAQSREAYGHAKTVIEALPEKQQAKLLAALFREMGQNWTADEAEREAIRQWTRQAYADGKAAVAKLAPDQQGEPMAALFEQMLGATANAQEALAAYKEGFAAVDQLPESQRPKPLAALFANVLMALPAEQMLDAYTEGMDAIRKLSDPRLRAEPLAALLAQIETLVELLAEDQVEGKNFVLNAYAEGRAEIIELPKDQQALPLTSLFQQFERIAGTYNLSSDEMWVIYTNGEADVKGIPIDQRAQPLEELIGIVSELGESGEDQDQVLKAYTGCKALVAELPIEQQADLLMLLIHLIQHLPPDKQKGACNELRRDVERLPTARRAEVGEALEEAEADLYE